MKQVVLKVEDAEFDGFLTFLRTLDFVEIENQDVPEWQQSVVMDRQSAYNAGTLLSRKWETAKKDIFRRD